jgi:hypothetical protein
MRWVAFILAGIVALSFLRVTWDLWRSRKERPLR